MTPSKSFCYLDKTQILIILDRMFLLPVQVGKKEEGSRTTPLDTLNDQNHFQFYPVNSIMYKSAMPFNSIVTQSENLNFVIL